MSEVWVIAAGVASGIILATVVLPLALYASMYGAFEALARFGAWYHRDRTDILEVSPTDTEVMVHSVPEDMMTGKTGENR